jgi:hypothetical protein
MILMMMRMSLTYLIVVLAVSFDIDLMPKERRRDPFLSKSREKKMRSSEG